MKHSEIRKAFEDFFSQKNHRPVESSSLIPFEDPTLMFTNAGMNQFKDVFLGNDQRDYKRAVSVQKCLRAGGKHNDLENVGFTARHHTFFEMMGNFSFGDYFKKEAIAFAWEFLTVTLSIPKDRLYVTVFETDDEAAEIWHKQEGVPKDRIFRFGEKDNFWRMGATGPCGPCSEIFYDHNPKGPKIPIDQDEDRFVEIWNLVFMQFYEDENGKQTPLPKPSVDTGAGLERIAACLQGQRDNYKTDLFTPLMKEACDKAKIKKDWTELDEETQSALKVVADHSRAATFLIAEGVLPSNEGRGYVLRRIMRRAIRYARKLNEEKSIYPKVCKEVIKSMEKWYPELKKKKSFIVDTVEDEEKRFLQTLDKGSDILNKKIKDISSKGEKTVDGQTAFTLYDTYGFPLDLTQLMAKEKGLSVDTKGFEKHMAQAKDKARSAQKTHSVTASDRHLSSWSQALSEKQGPTPFLGYTSLQHKAKVIGLSDGQDVVEKLSGEGFVALSETPFYAEGGGQVGDRGEFKGKDAKASVSHCMKMNGVFLHEVNISKGSLAVGDTLEVTVENLTRQSTANNHSATHLMHAALKKVLGDHVAQAGSLVNENKLRFDFSHNQPVSESELTQIENLVNTEISKAVPVTDAIKTHKQALADGAVAMFGEKYGDEVRVITMGDFSMELCGGTHVQNTSQIQLFKIVSETGISAGTRRIEALTGQRAFRYLNKMTEENRFVRRKLKLQMPDVEEAPDSKDLLQSGVSEIAEKISELQTRIKDQEKEIKKLKSQKISVDDIINQFSEEKVIKGQQGHTLMAEVDQDDRNVLRDLADKIRDKKDNIVIVLFGEGNPQKPMIVAVSKSLKGVHAGQITKELCALMGGKGGGRPDFSQGSVTSINLSQAKEKLHELIQ